MAAHGDDLPVLHEDDLVQALDGADPVGDQDGGLALPAHLQVLEDENGKDLGTYESGKDGMVQIKDLKPGTYLIREIETLEGYSVSGEVIKLKLDEYYTVPEKLKQFVNYTTIQTGVHIAVTGVMWAGLGLMAISGTVGLIRRRRKTK